MRSGPLIAAFATVFVVTGCTAQVPPAAGPTSATATPAVESVESRPASQFPGDCSDLIPESRLVAVGGAATLDEPERDYTAADAAAMEQAGTLSCAWSFTSSGDERDELGMLLRRHADVLEPGLAGGAGIGYPGGTTAQLAADESSILCSEFEDQQTCQLAFIVGDYLAITHVTLTTPEDLATTSASFTSAISAAVDRLRAEPVPPVWTPPAGSWSLPVACETIVADGSLARALGWSAAAVVDDPAMGVEPRIGLGGSTECPLRDAGGDSGLIAILTAGGAWIWEEFAALPGVVEIDVDGADHAAILCDGSPGSCQAFAIVGANCITAIGSADYATGTSAALAERLEASLRGLVEGVSAVP